MLRKVLIFTLLILMNACSKQGFDIENLNGDKIVTLGHGGMGLDHSYPMNSLESILNCLMLGPDGIEIDVQMTRDSVLLAFHDELLEQRTNMEGKVHGYNWEELSGALYTETPFLSYSLVSMHDIFSAIGGEDKFLYSFDVKIYPAEGVDVETYFQTFARALARLIDEYGLADRVFIEAQHPRFLEIMQQLKPETPLFYYPPDFITGLAEAIESNYYGLSIAADNISREQVIEAHANGIKVMVWRLRSAAENRQAIEKSPDYIQTDRMKNLLKLLAR